MPIRVSVAHSYKHFILSLRSPCDFWTYLLTLRIYILLIFLHILFLFFKINLGILFMKQQTPCTNLSPSSIKSSVTDFRYSLSLSSDKMSIIVARWSSYRLQSQKICSCVCTRCCCYLLGSYHTQGNLPIDGVLLVTFYSLKHVFIVFPLTNSFKIFLPYVEWEKLMRTITSTANSVNN
jgi:hypothetical protein